MFPIVLIKWKKKAASKVSFINCIQDPWTAPWPHTLAGAILHDKSVALSPTLTRSAVCTLITALEGPPRKTTPLNTYLQQHQLTGNIHAKYSAWKIKSLQTISSKNPSIAERQTKPTYCSVLPDAPTTPETENLFLSQFKRSLAKLIFQSEKATCLLHA